MLERALATWTFDFAQVYGLTETGGAITYLTPADHRSGNRERLRSCGRVLRQADIRVVDAHGEVVPAGTAGEVVCRSPQNMQGYWRRDAERVLGDGWLRTGDVATLDADGYLFVHDRLDDMIVSGGENVYPSEVESVLTAHPAVADAGVVGVPDGRWGSRIVAFVVLAPGAAATADDLDTFLRGRIASFKVPKTITFVPALPRNAAGKLLRRELRASAT
ncbi:MAG: AMP-binding protein [Vicinamibacterales bacterium]